MNLYLENAKMLFGWGFDISYMIGVVITQEEYNEITQKTYKAEKAPTTQA